MEWKKRRHSLYPGNTALEASYLRHIIEAVSVRDQNAPFRTFFDNWRCYRGGVGLVTRSETPHWYNNPHPKEHWGALLGMEYCSPEARARIEAVRDGDEAMTARFDNRKGDKAVRLTVDHIVPISHLVELLFDHDEFGIIETLRDFLVRYYHRGVITHDEHSRLTVQGLNSKMPTDWKLGHDPFDRYHAIGLTCPRSVAETSPDPQREEAKYDARSSPTLA